MIPIVAVMAVTALIPPLLVFAYAMTMGVEIAARLIQQLGAAFKKPEELPPWQRLRSEARIERPAED